MRKQSHRGSQRSPSGTLVPKEEQVTQSLNFSFLCLGLSHWDGYLSWSQQGTSPQLAGASCATSTCECGLVWKLGLGRCSQVKMLKMGPKSNDWCLCGKREFGCRDKVAHGDGGRDWDAVSTGQGMPRIVRSNQKLGHRYGTDFLLEASERSCGFADTSASELEPPDGE